MDPALALIIGFAVSHLLMFPVAKPLVDQTKVLHIASRLRLCPTEVTVEKMSTPVVVGIPAVWHPLTRAVVKQLADLRVVDGVLHEVGHSPGYSFRRSMEELYVQAKRKK